MNQQDINVMDVLGLEVNMSLSDTAAERAVLSGICKYADNIYLEISDIIDAECFTIDSNKLIFECVKNYAKKMLRLLI
jgi:replicative DNA helicase